MSSDGVNCGVFNKEDGWSSVLQAFSCDGDVRIGSWSSYLVTLQNYITA